MTLKRQRKQAGKIVVKDAIADIALQQVLTRPTDFDVIATLNLNGDYLSDAWQHKSAVSVLLQEQISTILQDMLFSKLRTEQLLNMRIKMLLTLGSVILSGVMMLEHLGWQEAARPDLQRSGKID